MSKIISICGILIFLGILIYQYIETPTKDNSKTKELFKDEYIKTENITHNTEENSEIINETPTGKSRREWPMWVTTLTLVYPDSIDPISGKSLEEDLKDSCVIIGKPSDSKSVAVPMYEVMEIDDEEKGKFWYLYRYFAVEHIGELAYKSDKEFFVYTIKRKKVWYE